jgi:hypothetical protein
MSLARAARRPRDRRVEEATYQRRGGRHVDDVGGHNNAVDQHDKRPAPDDRRCRHRRPRIRDHHRSADDAARAYGRVRVATRLRRQVAGNADELRKNTCRCAPAASRRIDLVADDNSDASFRFASRADELYDKIDFSARSQDHRSRRDASDAFKQRMRASRAPGTRALDHRPGVARPAFPDALRGAEHNIELRPTADLNTVAARWRCMRRDDYRRCRRPRGERHTTSAQTA